MNTFASWIVIGLVTAWLLFLTWGLNEVVVNVNALLKQGIRKGDPPTREDYL